MDIARALFQVVIDLISFLFLLTRSQGKLAAENLFLRKQLAFYNGASSPAESILRLSLLLSPYLGFSTGKTHWHLYSRKH